MSDPRDAPAAWLFQGNPDLFDVDGYLAAQTNILWLAKQRASDMQPGQTVYLWRNQGKRTKADAGIVARGTITESPRVRPEHTDARRFWHEPTDELGDQLRVAIAVREVATKKHVVQAKWLVEDPECFDLPNLRMRQHTNYALGLRHARRIARLWERTGKDFDRSDLLLALRAYDETFGREVSKKPGGPVASTALLSGRAVTSIYAKVMNFRSCDPRVEGVGQANTGEPTQAIWDEFWTGDDIDRARLGTEISALFEPGNDPESIDSMRREAATLATYSAEGLRRLVTHMRIERNRKVVADAKAEWALADPLLRCSVCRFSFAEAYGPIGQGYIEAHHHAIPIAKLDQPVVPSVADLMPVCANCHRMLHRGDAVSEHELKRAVEGRRADLPPVGTS